MNIYIFEYVEKLTTRYHPEGGLVIIAESEDRAREMFNSQYADYEYSDKPMLSDKDIPKVYPITASEEEMFIFPYAGCC